MSRKTLFAFIVSFVLLATAIVLNRLTFERMKQYSYWVNHTRQVITTFESISDDFKSAQIYTTTYKNDSLKNYYNLYKKNADQINTELAQLKELVKDNVEQSLLVDSLITSIKKHLPLLMQKNIAEIISMGQGWRINQLFIIHETINHGIQHEKDLLAERTRELSNFTNLNNWLSIAFSVLAVVIFIFTFLNILFISKKRRWLEGFLESILNTSQNGVAHYKAIREHGKIVDFKIEFLNESFDGLLHLDSESMIGQRLSEISSFSWETGLIKKFIEVVESGNPCEFEIFYKKNGAECWLLVSLAKLNDGITASFHNISHLKNIEEELKNKITDLQKSNAELEQYAYVASHDLQEPLRKIRSFGSYLQDTESNKLGERGQQLLDKIVNAAERMSLLIKDILSYSSLKRQADFIPVDLNEIIRNVQQDLDLLIAQKNATIECEVLPNIEAVPLQISQLFYNLLTNSLKFAKQNELPHIKIASRLLPSEEKRSSFKTKSNYYEIILSDNGIGFDQMHADQIFGLFKRLNSKQVYPGTGIGLSLCKKVVENHGGEIYATGKEGVGATFHIYLPEKQL